MAQNNTLKGKLSPVHRPMNNEDFLDWFWTKSLRTNPIGLKLAHRDEAWETYKRIVAWDGA
jgi:hypothetical protein